MSALPTCLFTAVSVDSPATGPRWSFSTRIPHAARSSCWPQVLKLLNTSSLPVLWTHSTHTTTTLVCERVIGIALG